MDGWILRERRENFLGGEIPTTAWELNGIPLCRKVELRGAAMGAFLLPPPPLSFPIFRLSHCCSGGLLLITSQNALLCNQQPLGLMATSGGG